MFRMKYFFNFPWYLTFILVSIRTFRKFVYSNGRIQESECIKGARFTHGNFPKKHVKIIYLSGSEKRGFILSVIVLNILSAVIIKVIFTLFGVGGDIESYLKLWNKEICHELGNK